MPTLRRYTVVPRLPTALERLRNLAYNLWWTWNHDAREMFEILDPNLWESLHQNPVSLLARIPQHLLDDFARDDAYLTQLEAQYNAFERYMARDGWFPVAHPDLRDELIAYFSMEFGLHECVPVYSGGLGVLAGDTLKTGSDLDIPMVGVGIAYAEGYFRQTLNEDGWQMERYPLNDWLDLPVSPVHDESGVRIRIEVPYPGRTVTAQAWRVQVGRVPLYLLDANMPENAPEDRRITNALYGGDNDHRVRQEILLGIGGIRLLAALKMVPTVCHMNEGHSAFLAIERIIRAMRDHQVSYDAALELSSSGNVFTTHTPVPAGLDQFDHKLVGRYLESFREQTGTSTQQLLELGMENPEDPHGKFSMPVLAIRSSKWHNGVSELHGGVSRKMWSDLWPELPIHEVPIRHVTNGIHASSWTCSEMGDLLTRYLGPRWREEVDEPELWQRVHRIPDSELWHVHQRRRMRLVRFCRAHMSHILAHKGAGREEQQLAAEALDSEALTIGFARRFATYKRAALLLHDRERLERLLCDNDRPVQLVIAGKAHPHDDKGKDLIRTLVHASQSPPFRGRIVFIEDYDMGVARRIVSGVDLWLNTPRRPMEASGTSGMKVAFNGGLNASVLDGWWCEAWTPDIGWAIGRGEEYEDAELGDTHEALSLYQLLEKEIVPTFYDRGLDRMPRRWIAMMKRSMAAIGPAFNTMRMMRAYADDMYVPAIRRRRLLGADNTSGARDLTAWKQRIRKAWPAVRIDDLREKNGAEIPVGVPLNVEADVVLGSLTPDDVRVELYHGHLEGGQDLTRGDVSPMRFVSRLEDGKYRFEGSVSSNMSGSHAYAVRVLPSHPTMTHGFEMALIRWA